MAATQVPLTVLHAWSAVTWCPLLGTWILAMGLLGCTVVEALVLPRDDTQKPGRIPSCCTTPLLALE